MVQGAPVGSVERHDHPGGRYYASFVVEVAATPLPASRNDVGVDLGLARLATLSTGEVIENPRHLRWQARALARAQRALARKTSGSNNRKRAVRRVAVLHRGVRETRLVDAHHKLALRLIRDNQAVYVEDLAVSGLARTRLAKSVHDAGWATPVRLLEEKAERCHRQVVCGPSLTVRILASLMVRVRRKWKRPHRGVGGAVWSAG